MLFGGLLSAMLIGLGAGYLAASLLSIPLLLASLVGIAFGLISGGILLSIFFRRKNRTQLYPVIIDILKKGDHYGSA